MFSRFRTVPMDGCVRPVRNATNFCMERHLARAPTPVQLHAGAHGLQSAREMRSAGVRDGSTVESCDRLSQLSVIQSRPTDRSSLGSISACKNVECEVVEEGRSDEHGRSCPDRLVVLR